jgi:AcrR family transcriptional regulator
LPRITKNPEERKNELIQTAETLFIEKGYEQTTVSDIVKKINVAQGTFYYHFDSKADILQAVVEKSIRVREEELRRILRNGSDDPAAQLNEMINSILRISLLNKKLLTEIHKDSNSILHDKTMTLFMERLVPLLTEVVEKGVAEGRFSIPHPLETVEVLLAAVAFHFHQADFVADMEHRRRVRETLEHILAKVFVAEGYTYHLEI